jgi:hypothetical protein
MRAFGRSGGCHKGRDRSSSREIDLFLQIISVEEHEGVLRQGREGGGGEKNSKQPQTNDFTQINLFSFSKW